MAMQAESLEVLEKANVPTPQARAIVRAIEIEIDGAKDTLATKHDLLLLRQEMTERFHGLESKLETRCGGLDAKVEALRGELKTAISEQQGELEAAVAELRAEIRDFAGKGAWRLYGALVAQLTMLLGIAYFFVTHVIR